MPDASIMETKSEAGEQEVRICNLDKGSISQTA